MLDTKILTPAQRHLLIEREAYKLWKDEARRSHRSVQDWLDAIHLLLKKLGHFPSAQEINAEAYSLYEARRQSRSHEDWVKAEQLICAIY